MQYPQLHLVALMVSTLTLACADSSSGPTPGEDSAFNYSNAPGSLANVFRFPGIVGGAAFVDAATDLVAFDGLPANPADATICGGTEEIASLADFQVTGDLREVYQALIQAEENIHVYQLSSFEDICTSEPIAQGTGSLTINDNDLTGSGTRANTFGGRLVGSVTLAAGGTAHLTAEVRFVVEPDGTFRQVSSKVVLSQ
jgi:hypothetical protein